MCCSISGVPINMFGDKALRTMIRVSIAADKGIAIFADKIFFIFLEAFHIVVYVSWQRERQR